MNIANYRTVDLTVVITTLGDDSLTDTLACVKRSTVLPRHIFLCVPRQFAHLVIRHEDDITSIVPTSEMGQVQQRLSGFKNVKTEMVLQLDDDIYFEADSIEKIYLTSLKLGSGFVVGGTIDRRDAFVRESWGNIDFLVKLRRKCLNVLADAPTGDSCRAGRYSKFTWFKLVEPNPTFEGYVFSDIVPGGFCMSWVSDLVLENYYPLNGKAYKEDLVNSCERTKRGIRHVIVPSVVICSEENTSFSFSSARSHFIANHWIGIYLGCSRYSLRLHIYIILEVLYDVYRRARIRIAKSQQGDTKVLL